MFLLDPFTRQGWKSKEFKRIAIFVQKSNDLDTCASALALCLIINRLYKYEKIRIIGIRNKSSFLPETKRFQLDKEEEFLFDNETLAILVDVNAIREIEKPNLKQLKECGTILRIDHHRETDGLEQLYNPETSEMLQTVDYRSSTCEIIWELSKHMLIQRTNKDFIGKIAYVLFHGVYGDSKQLTSLEVDHRTFNTLAEMSEYVELIPIIRRLKEFSTVQWAILRDLINELVHDGNLTIVNLTPGIVYKYWPHLLKKEESWGKIAQRSLIMFPLNHLENYLEANTIIYFHYCLRNPFNEDKKIVFIVTKKENKELEELLLANNFFKNRDRFSSKNITFSQMVKLIEDNRDLFIK